MGAPICHKCKRAIRGPRIVIKERWTCAECAYYLDQGAEPPGKAGK